MEFTENTVALCSVDFKMFSFGMSNVMVLSGHRSEGRTSDTIYRTNAK